jgi:Beta/Gamma crystallin
VLYATVDAVSGGGPLPRDAGGGPAVARPAGEIPQIVAFDKEGLLGDHIHIFGDTADLGKWDNSISSMVILGGHWEFFDDDHFKGAKMGELGPGVYLRVQDHGLKDNSISSIRLVRPRGQ